MGWRGDESPVAEWPQGEVQALSDLCLSESAWQAFWKNTLKSRYPRMWCLRNGKQLGLSGWRSLLEKKNDQLFINHFFSCIVYWALPNTYWCFDHETRIKKLGGGFELCWKPVIKSWYIAQYNVRPANSPTSVFYLMSWLLRGSPQQIGLVPAWDCWHPPCNVWYNQAQPGNWTHHHSSTEIAQWWTWVMLNKRAHL